MPPGWRGFFLIRTHSRFWLRCSRALIVALVCALALAHAPQLTVPQLAQAASRNTQRNGAVVPSLGEADVRTLRERGTVKAALTELSAGYERMVRDLVVLTEIPAPSFKEEARAARFAALLREAGLKDAYIDEEGNVVAERRGVGGGPTLVLAAHLDTVFPPGTDVRVKKNGTVYSAPGIGDDTHGLAVMLAIVRALQAARLPTRGDLIFVGDVGEEGLGNLRGVRYLFEKSDLRKRIDLFISLDGLGDNAITNGGVGSRRFRVTFKGPGGHSYGAFGLVNPAYALAAAADRISRIRVPKTPKTTYNIGVYGGGTSVNSIPDAVWMEVDLRSESPAELAKLETRMRAAVILAVAEENRERSTQQGALTVDVKLIGEREAGLTPASSPIVQTAAAVTRAMGRTPVLRYSSTDSNVPMSMGIPAITIGSGGRGGRAHSLAEWVDVDKATTLPGMERALLIALGLVGVE